MTQLGLFDGQGPTLAREGQERVLAHQRDSWADLTVANIVSHLRTHAEYCPDDLYRYQLMPYAPHHPNAIGALTKRLIASGYLERVGSTHSRRTDAQARRIEVYRSKVYRGRVEYDR